MIKVIINNCLTSFISKNEFMPLRFEDGSQKLAYGAKVTDSEKKDIKKLKEKIINGDIKITEEKKW